MLSQNHHLYRGRDGLWIYSGPQDSFTKIHADPEIVGAVAAKHRAQNPEDSAQSTSFLEIEQQLLSRGVLTTRSNPSFQREPVIEVVGDGLVAEWVKRIAESSGIAYQQGAALTIDCAGWLPDQRWRAEEESKPQQPKHYCHYEPGSIVLGPFSIPGRTPQYRDLRGRRLAAAAQPEQMRELWGYLESGTEILPPVEDEASAALAAGLLMADVLAYLRGTPIPSENHQLVLHRETSTLTRHYVLPLPSVAVNG
ncbi:hypothetical protein [Psychromicrobium sp. YIM B11713]|uniref:hypothetical protein n=1 Tax=Psychromicrobium sp. YIM B11713 TaxID=3145233 RepID=UPI00374EA42F